VKKGDPRELINGSHIMITNKIFILSLLLCGTFFGDLFQKSWCLTSIFAEISFGPSLYQNLTW
jgi:hypothetical protein